MLFRVLAWLVVVSLSLAGASLIVADGGPKLLGVFTVGMGVTWLVLDRMRRKSRQA